MAITRARQACILSGAKFGSVANLGLLGELSAMAEARGRSKNDFKGRHFRGEIVLWAVRWYCRYAVSYRDLEGIMSERGVAVDHSTIYRWVQRLAPKMKKRLRWQWGAAQGSGSSLRPPGRHHRRGENRRAGLRRRTGRSDRGHSAAAGPSGQRRIMKRPSFCLTTARLRQVFGRTRDSARERRAQSKEKEG